MCHNLHTEIKQDKTQTTGTEDINQETILLNEAVQHHTQTIGLDDRQTTQVKYSFMKGDIKKENGGKPCPFSMEFTKGSLPASKNAIICENRTCEITFLVDSWSDEYYLRVQAKSKTSLNYSIIFQPKGEY